MGLFIKKEIIYSNLNRETLLEVLKQNVEPFKRDNSKYMFEGKIKENGNFVIYPSFDYNSRNQIRPIITGVVSNNLEKGLLIEVSLKLPEMMKGLIGTVILINLIVCLFLYLNDAFFKWYFLFSFICVFCLVAYAIYIEKVKKSIAVLKKILK